MKFLAFVMAACLVVFAPSADAAKRLGGGKSVGQQSSNVTKREAAKPATAPQQQNAAPAQQQPAPAAAAAQPKKPWGAMLGGLAAGLGLAWLASSLGLGAEFGQFLMFGLLALAIMLAIGWFMRSRNKGAPSSGAISSPYAMQGASAAGSTVEPKAYNPANVGNDASARPWERQSMSFDASKVSPTPTGSMIGSALRSPLEGAQNWGVPANFDIHGFIAAAKQNFVTLQAAWDRADMGTLRSMMTDEMLREIQGQLAEREQISPNAAGQTEVLMLDAQLLGIEELPGHYMASVEFSGMIREDATAGPAPFREVWNMTKPKNGSAGWLVAGLQALQ